MSPELLCGIVGLTCLLLGVLAGWEWGKQDKAWERALLKAKAYDEGVKAGEQAALDRILDKLEE